MKLLVQAPPYAAPRAILLSYNGPVPGSQLNTALCDFFYSPGSLWAISGVPLKKMTVGSGDLVDGAHLTLISGTPNNRTSAALSPFTCEVLHGPDSRISLPLERGRWQLGRSPSADLQLADPALLPLEAAIEIEHSGVRYVSKGQSTELKLGQPFRAGNSILCITRRGTAQGNFTPTTPREVDVPASRSKLLTYAMVLLPLIIGTAIALLTGLWLLLAMSIGSSVLMGLHAFASGGETRKTRELILHAAQLDKENARCFRLSNSPLLVPVMGQKTRVAKVLGKNRDIGSAPWLDAAPLEVTLDDIKSSLSSLPVASKRLALVYVAARSEQLSVLLSKDDSESYRQLVEPLLALPQVTPIFSPQHITHSTICERPTPANQQEHTPYVLMGQPEPVTPLPAVLETAQLDGISPKTYCTLLGEIMVDAAQVEHQLPRAASEIPLFASPTSGALATTGSSDIFFYAGASTEGKGLLTYGLNTHGPHFLCAGTTGSGKSQFLRSVLWSMALGVPASRLRFILFDFKGGAGLGPLSNTPHCTAFVTDLEVSGLERSLKYLRADLRKREKAFHTIGVSSHADYAAHCTATGQPLDFPEVVLCIDEFKMLVDQHPSIMNELMRIATIGRSLGYHLFLATQRPQGAVSPEIRSNISTAFCLRVSSTQDSYNVISSEDAASIPAQAPGLGYVKDSEHRLLQFQAPLIDGYYRAEDPYIRTLHFITEPSSSNEHIASPSSALSDQDLSNLCASIPQPAFESPQYQPVPPPLCAPEDMSINSGHNLYIGDIEVPDTAVSTPWIWTDQQGALLLLGTASERNKHIFALIRQALVREYRVLSFSASEQFTHRVREQFADSSCYAYSLKDFEFVRGLLGELEENGNPTLIVLDSFEGVQDSLPRFPEFEAKLTDLCSPLGASDVRVICTASAPLRGRFQQVFSHKIFSGSYLESDPLRSHQKDYNRPLCNQFSIEGSIVDSLAEDLTDSGVLCFSESSSSLRQAVEGAQHDDSFQQLPSLLRADEIFYGDGPYERPLIGFGRRSTPALLPALRNGFIAVSGKRGSGKSSFLRSFRALNPQLPVLLVQGQGTITVPILEQVLQEHQSAACPPVLCVDDVHLLPHEVQKFILKSKDSFSLVIMTYTPWPRWSTSPLLSALSGTETGIVLAPENASDLSFYAGAATPWDLRTQGAVPPGRGLIIDHGSTTAFQTPLAAEDF